MRQALAPRLHEKPRYLRFTPTFMTGVGNALNIFGSFNPMYYGRDPVKADREALRSDWEMIGRDMQHVMALFEEEHRRELEARGAVSMFANKQGD